MQYLFSARKKLEKKIIPASRILLALDFDGTLTELQPRPQDVKLNYDMRQLLRQLARHKSWAVAIISGRGLKDLQQRTGKLNLIFAGNHGLEINYQGKHFVYPPAKKFIPVIRAIAGNLKKRLALFKQAVLENKGLSLSLHYRLVSSGDIPKLKKIFWQVIRPYLSAGKIRITYGKKVWEIRPPISENKGKALLWLRRRLVPQPQLAIYIGDDLTDEDAFRAANSIGGISIRVGRRKKSAAQYYIRNTKDSWEFLSLLRSLKMKNGPNE